MNSTQCDTRMTATGKRVTLEHWLDEWTPVGTIGFSAGCRLLADVDSPHWRLRQGGRVWRMHRASLEIVEGRT